MKPGDTSPAAVYGVTLDNSKAGQKAASQYVDQEIAKQNEAFTTGWLLVVAVLVAALLTLTLWQIVKRLR